MKKITYSAPSVKKAFKILYAISDSSDGLGISDLSKKLKIGKSTVHGITTALEELGILVRDPLYKRYTAGYSLLELCRAAFATIDLKDVARKPMEKLMGKVGETVFLGVLNGDHVTIVDMVESRNDMKITSPPGTKLPLLAGATGRVLLSQIDMEKSREMVQKKGLVSQGDWKSKRTGIRRGRRRIHPGRPGGSCPPDVSFLASGGLMGGRIYLYAG